MSDSSDSRAIERSDIDPQAAAKIENAATKELGAGHPQHGEFTRKLEDKLGAGRELAAERGLVR